MGPASSRLDLLPSHNLRAADEQKWNRDFPSGSARVIVEFIATSKTGGRTDGQ